MATTYSQPLTEDSYPVIPGLDNSTLPRDIIEAYARPHGPYTLDNSSRLLDEQATLELINGWLVWKEMADFNERRIANNIEVILDLAARDAKFGQSYPDKVEAVLSDGTIIKPDTCVVSTQRAKSRTTRMGPDNRLMLQGTPELVAELRSPSNTRASDKTKRAKYFANGTLIVWDVDPERRYILVWRASDPDNAQRFNLNDEITCELFPGWKRKVEDFFKDEQTAREIVGDIAAPWIEEGRQKGLAEGQRFALSDTIRSLLGMRFGSENLPPDLAERLVQLPVEQLNTLTLVAATAPSLTDWLAAL
jgi:Uma2 family endonuclease